MNKENKNLEELNVYLKMLADMDRIGVRRKLVLLEGYIHKIKKDINKESKSE